MSEKENAQWTVSLDRQLADSFREIQPILAALFVCMAQVVDPLF